MLKNGIRTVYGRASEDEGRLLVLPIDAVRLNVRAYLERKCYR